MAFILSIFRVPNKEDEHSSGYSLNGGPTDHNYTSMALVAPTLSNSEFDQEKADSPSAASTRLMLASPSSILSPEINCYLLTPRSRTFPLIVPQEPLSPSLHYIPIMGLSPTRPPPSETESLNSGAPPCSLFG
ncbi:hypothetical protein I3843_01G166000 [Carya illinoinensis]|nr:hypothetical protein I3843_01G166000 [Carya illinoinensis]